MTWARGRDEVQRLIDDNEIERVEASTEVAAANATTPSTPHSPHRA